MAYFNITNDAYAIMQIQRILRDLELLENEYSSVPISGVYDDETRGAVVAFQSKYDLQPTGIVDYDTWQLLHSVHKATEFERRGPRMVRLVPDRGGFAIYPDQIDDIIYVIQYMLSTISIHYDDFGTLAYTGIYDENTQNAIKSFQRKNLLDANGIIDGPTLEALFDEYEGTILERS